MGSVSALSSLAPLHSFHPTAVSTVEGSVGVPKRAPNHPNTTLANGETTLAGYDDLDFKKPVESDDYKACSDFVIAAIDGIIKAAIKTGNNRIIINTNLRLGLPMENINKIAGPFVEAWAVEIFDQVVEDKNNTYRLINVESKERLYMADIILQFERKTKTASAITAEVDVKATAEDIVGSGKSPNLTSFARIRTAYVDDPDYIFVVLSLKHKVYSKRNADTNLMDGVMEVVSHNTYDLKFISSKDLSYNPALGSGQIQVRDIHYVALENRTAWEFCLMLDKKYFASRAKTLESWLLMAKKHGWIK